MNQYDKAIKILSIAKSEEDINKAKDLLYKKLYMAKQYRIKSRKLKKSKGYYGKET